MKVWNQSHGAGLRVQGRLPQRAGLGGFPICPRGRTRFATHSDERWRGCCPGDAKAWSRYAKELLAWTDKRANYGETSFFPAPDDKQDPNLSCL